MIVHDETTWPSELLRCLEHYKEILLAWEQRRIGINPSTIIDASSFDDAIYAIRHELCGLRLNGYHCTRLTETEISAIQSNGMNPQNSRSLNARINALVATGELNSEIAGRLMSENQADEDNRIGMLWFCFFPPHLAGQSGIERFFRSWGGEALYNSHEDDLETGPALKAIGAPCIIEADVPVEEEGIGFLEIKVARIFLKNRGFNTPECIDHEGYTTNPIPTEYIKRVVRYPENDFYQLTRAENWDPPL